MEKKLVKKLEKVIVDSAELRLRIEKLEKEKEVLEEKIKQLKLDREVKKISTDFSMTTYETQAIAIKNEANKKKEKEILMERFSQMIIGLDTIEKKINESHDTIIQKLAHLEEKVLVVEEPVVEKTILVLGVKIGNGQRDTMLLLTGNQWEKLSLKLPKGVNAGGAVYLNGEIYVFGGEYMNKELYKLDNKVLEWRKLADMNEERYWITNSSLEWNGSIWVFGGLHGNNRLKSVERYDPKEDKWNKMTDMKNPRYNAAASVHNEKFIICGGCNGSSLSSVECFDPESGIWTELTDMPASCLGHSLVSLENRLILMGGYGTNTVWELTEAETWKELPSMKYSEWGFDVAVLDKDIYVIGGNGKPRAVEIFNGETWRDGSPLPHGCSNIPSLVIPKHLADTLCMHTI